MMKLFYVFLLALSPSMASAKEWRLSMDVSQSEQSSAKLTAFTPQLDALLGGRLGLFAGQMQYPNIKGTEKEYIRTREGGLALGFTGPLMPFFSYMTTTKLGYVQAPAVQNLSKEHKYMFMAVDSGFALSTSTKNTHSWVSALLFETGIGWQVNWTDRTEVTMIGNTMIQDDFFYPYLRLHFDF